MSSFEALLRLEDVEVLYVAPAQLVAAQVQFLSSSGHGASLQWDFSYVDSNNPVPLASCALGAQLGRHLRRRRPGRGVAGGTDHNGHQALAPVPVGGGAQDCSQTGRVCADQHHGRALGGQPGGLPRSSVTLRAGTARWPGWRGTVIYIAMPLAEVPTPPLAPRRAVNHLAHDDTREDDWYWLADRDDPAVMAYLEAENAYADATMAPTAPLQDRLFEQIRSRVAETDISSPIFHGGWCTGPAPCRPAVPGALSAARPQPVPVGRRVLAAARAALVGAGVAGDGTPAPGPVKPRT